MSWKQIGIFVSITTVLAMGSVSIHGQEKKSELKDKRITIQEAEKPLYYVFIKLMYVYDVPIGFEESTLDKDHNDYFFQTNVPPDEERSKYLNEPRLGWNSLIKNHLITLNFKDARLEDVLNKIVEQMQNYDWEINNDVVNIFPTKGRDPRFQKLLNLTIRGFSISKGEKV